MLRLCTLSHGVVLVMAGGQKVRSRTYYLAELHELFHSELVVSTDGIWDAVATDLNAFKDGYVIAETAGPQKSSLRPLCAFVDAVGKRA